MVELNFPIDVYSGYYMKITGGLVDLFRINDGSPSYPYEIPGIVALTGSNVADTPLDFYYFFFDYYVHYSSINLIWADRAYLMCYLADISETYPIWTTLLSENDIRLK